MFTTLLRSSAVVALTAGLATGLATPSHASERDRWSPDLRSGEGSAVVTGPDGVRLAAVPGRGAEQLGILTLAPHALTGPTDRVRTALDADVPAGSTATVDVRGREIDGGWGEWTPAADGEAELAQPSSEVQGRLVLTGNETAAPLVRAVEMEAGRPTRPRITVSADPALRYRVFATREGLIGGTTANGHVIAEEDHFVALPSRRALAPKGTGDYSVRVCTATRCGYAPVWDVGPWNTRDDYWNPADVRQEWKELPQGMPQAQTAHLDDFNGGRDQFDRDVLNPAGIDLSDAFFYDLGLDDNAWVDVDYLWTGERPLGTVGAEAVVVRASASADADEVGFAGRFAQVPAECLTEGVGTSSPEDTTGGGPDDRWLRIGEGQYIPAGAVTWTRRPGACTPAADPGSAAAVDTGRAVAGDRTSAEAGGATAGGAAANPAHRRPAP